METSDIKSDAALDDESDLGITSPSANERIAATKETRAAWTCNRAMLPNRIPYLPVLSSSSPMFA